ncbi:hypothetical protein V1523DRAFT_421148 [Lipomyces doorenjongii]
MLFPRLRAKIIDRNGAIVPQGSRGELCIAGYFLQKGYFKIPEKTHEAMKRDKEGTLWLHTGDEASSMRTGITQLLVDLRTSLSEVSVLLRGCILLVFRGGGNPVCMAAYCCHTGGENIYPVEIEERLCEHDCISRAAVVGIQNARYGEAVGAKAPVQISALEKRMRRPRFHKRETEKLKSLNYERWRRRPLNQGRIKIIYECQRGQSCNRRQHGEGV